MTPLLKVFEGQRAPCSGGVGFSVKGYIVGCHVEDIRFFTTDENIVEHKEQAVLRHTPYHGMAGICRECVLVARPCTAHFLRFVCNPYHRTGFGIGCGITHHEFLIA